MKAERDAWRQEFAAIDPARLVFIDESGASTAMDRTHGRSPSGKRFDGPVPHGHGKVVTLTAAVRLGGVPEAACLAFDGATKTALKQWLRSAKARTVDALIEATGDALRAVRPGDILGWFGHGGYHLPGSTARLKRKSL